MMTARRIVWLSKTIEKRFSTVTRELSAIASVRSRTYLKQSEQVAEIRQVPEVDLPHG